MGGGNLDGKETFSKSQISFPSSIACQCASARCGKSSPDSNSVAEQLTLFVRSAEPAEMKIINSNGQSVWRSQHPAGEQSYQLNSTNWASGVYYLLVENDNYRERRKIVKR
ncbi:MAG: T9SS type A sorting domain-containing protein [Bacteroidota bacterium]